MPGIPATSPRFGIARYADTDTAAFSSQVNAITDGFDAKAAKNLSPVSVSGAHTAVDGELVVATATQTTTLPAHSSGQVVGLMNLIGAGGVMTVNGTNIQGVGLSSASSFTLGTYGSRVVLLDDGTNWLMVEGQLDTGWVALTFNANWAAVAGYSVPAYRVSGDRVLLRGGAQNNTGASNASPFATLPVAARPSASREPTINLGVNGGGGFQVTTSGVTGITPTVVSTGYLFLDSCAYSL